jgi:hypothetical protein
MRERSSAGPSDLGILASFLAWLTLYFAARFYLEANASLPPGSRLAIAFAPAPVFAWFLWRFIRSVRDADELEKRIQLEALAIAFPLGLLLLTTLGLVQRAVELNFQDWSYNHVWPMFAFFYMGGIVIARHRYQ